jgi:hypothetical protein
VAEIRKDVQNKKYFLYISYICVLCSLFYAIKHIFNAKIYSANSSLFLSTRIKQSTSAKLRQYVMSDHLREGEADLPDKVTDGQKFWSRNCEDRAVLLIREFNSGH